MAYARPNRRGVVLVALTIPLWCVAFYLVWPKEAHARWVSTFMRVTGWPYTAPYLYSTYWGRRHLGACLEAPRFGAPRAWVGVDAESGERIIIEPGARAVVLTPNRYTPKYIPAAIGITSGKYAGESVRSHPYAWNDCSPDPRLLAHRDPG